MELRMHDFAFTRHVAPLGGMALVPAPHMVEAVEDWTRVRSPSRARRRMRQGHRQNMRTIEVPSKDVIIDKSSGTMYAHPATIEAITQEMAIKFERAAEAMMLDGYRPLARTPLAMARAGQ